MKSDIWSLRLSVAFVGLLCTGMSLSAPGVAGDTTDPAEILKQSDRARGGGLPGVVWDVDVVSSGNDDATDGERRLRVEATQTSSVAETLVPVRFAGSKLLQVERNMWMTRPGLAKPIPISPRQKLSGQAANGDIAATNYAGDYTATLLREDTFDNQPCDVLQLTAKTKQATYDSIVYWVSHQSVLGVKAEFFSLSGKVLKTATFRYDNKIDYNGQPLRFVSAMLIHDALTPAQTLLTFANVKVQKVPPSEFDVGSMQ